MNYWNIADVIVDAAALLAEDKPVFKAIIGTIDSIIESKASGVTNSDIIDVVKSQAKSKWNDVKTADLTEIADIIGENIDLNLKTDETKKDTGWLGKIWSLLLMSLGFIKPIITNPEIKKIIGYAEILVKAKDTGISNDALKDSLVAMSKSAWNNLDATKITKIMAVVTTK